jgi:hypothetical protein
MKLIATTSLINLQENQQYNPMQASGYAMESKVSAFNNAEALGIYLKALSKVSTQTQEMIDLVKKKQDVTTVYQGAMKILEAFTRGFAVCHSQDEMKLAPVMHNTTLHITTCMNSGYLMKDTKHYEEALKYLGKMEHLVHQMVEVNSKSVYVDSAQTNVQIV